MKPSVPEAGSSLPIPRSPDPRQAPHTPAPARESLTEAVRALLIGATIIDVHTEGFDSDDDTERVPCMIVRTRSGHKLALVTYRDTEGNGAGCINLFTIPVAGSLPPGAPPFWRPMLWGGR